MFILFCVLLDSMSFSPVSMYVASLDVDTMSIRLIMLSSTWSICFVSFLLGFHSSLPYVIMGMIHVSINFHIVSICIPFRIGSPAIVNMVCSAPSTFLLASSIWCLVVFYGLLFLLDICSSPLF